MMRSRESLMTESGDELRRGVGTVYSPDFDAELKTFLDS
jgi:hypothetical protein